MTSMFESSRFFFIFSIFRPNNPENLVSSEFSSGAKNRDDYSETCDPKSFYYATGLKSAPMTRVR